MDGGITGYTMSVNLSVSQNVLRLIIIRLIRLFTHYLISLPHITPIITIYTQFMFIEVMLYLPPFETKTLEPRYTL